MNKPDKLEVWDEAKLILMFGSNCYVNTEDEHYKFWAIEEIEKGFKTSWGRIGTNIITKEFEIYNPSTSIQKKIEGKLKKGYRRIG